MAVETNAPVSVVTYVSTLADESMKTSSSIVLNKTDDHESTSATTEPLTSAGAAASPAGVEIATRAGNKLANRFQATSNGAGVTPTGAEATVSSLSSLIEGARSSQSVKLGIIAIMGFALAV